ncbi:MAG TPA: hypothetical protein VF026_21460 [Ktedonobacteraceae bacterium]
MQRPFSLSDRNHTNDFRQATVLLLLGVVFLAIARLGMLNSYSMGVLLLGLGMLGAAPFNPRRFLSAGWLTTTLGAATFLMFQHYIPDSQTLTAHLLAIGVGLLGIAWMARHGHIGAGALTPGVFVVAVGATEYLQAIHLIPSTVVPFALSLWLPGSGLFVLGLVCLAMNGRTSIQAKRHLANRTGTNIHDGSSAVHSTNENGR